MSQQKPRKGIWEWIWNKEKEKEKPKEREKGKDDRVVNSNSNSTDEKTDSISHYATTTITSTLKAKATDISEDLTKARSIIADIEKIIQSEIETVGDGVQDSPSKLSQSNSNSKKKRPGPKLIRPLNKRKTRMVMGDMIFDPTQNIWIGNEKDLQAFKQPALITHMGNLSPKDCGEMVYDPDLKVWRGNEKILRKFRSIRRPKLIGPTENMVSELEHKGMSFDQETMTWRGNDEDVLEFDGFEVSETDRQFKVGNEFNLSAEMKDSFRRSEEANKRQLKGWFKDRPGIDRHVHSHLSLIRNMSIMKIINLAKQTPQLSSSLDNMPPARTRSLSGSSDVTSSPIRAYAHRTISAPGTPKFSSDEDDWNDIELPKSPKLKLTISAPHLRADVDEDSDKSTERPKRANKSLLDKLQQFKEKEDINDDVDFSSFSPATLTNKVASSLKVSDAEDSGISSEGEHLDEDDDFESEDKDWEGLDVPTAPLSLRKFSDASDANFSEGEKEVDSKPHTPLTKSGDSVRSTSSVKSIEEWTDVDVPATGFILKTPIQRSPASAELPTNIEDDEISGLEIPSSGLTLRPRAPSSAEDIDLAHDEEDDENWDDISIPDEVVEKLKTLPGTLVTQPIIKQTIL